MLDIKVGHYYLSEYGDIYSCIEVGNFGYYVKSEDMKYKYKFIEIYPYEGVRITVTQWWVDKYIVREIDESDITLELI